MTDQRSERGDPCRTRDSFSPRCSVSGTWHEGPKTDDFQGGRSCEAFVVCTAGFGNFTRVTDRSSHEIFITLLRSTMTCLEAALRQGGPRPILEDQPDLTVILTVWLYVHQCIIGKGRRRWKRQSCDSLMRRAGKGEAAPPKQVSRKGDSDIDHAVLYMPYVVVRMDHRFVQYQVDDPEETKARKGAVQAPNVESEVRATMLCRRTGV